jgi:hypothetical protein
MVLLAALATGAAGLRPALADGTGIGGAARINAWLAPAWSIQLDLSGKVAFPSKGSGGYDLSRFRHARRCGPSRPRLLPWWPVASVHVLFLTTAEGRISSPG